MQGPEVHTAEAVIDNGRFGTRTINFETGRLAKQAAGSALITLDEETTILSATTVGKSPREGFDFFPLTVDVEERMYAAGRIPGSFFRREGRPTTDAILACRLIDRPLRPAFTKGIRNEVQVVETVLAINPDDLYDVVAINGASMSTQLSGLPFSGPIGGVRVALVDDGQGEPQWVAFPKHSQLEDAVFDMVVAGRIAGDDIAVMMVEAEATDDSWKLIKEQGKAAPTEDIVAAGLEAAKPFIRTLCEAQADLAARAGKEPVEVPIFTDYEDDVFEAVKNASEQKLASIYQIADKQERDGADSALKAELIEELAGEGKQFEGRDAEIGKALGSVTKQVIRQRILRDQVRIDGRGLTDIRQLTAEVEVLPRVHGSAIFERGETQIMGVTT
ncbi:MAG TPA: polyribonucleotide nucleotidyltransferase, partial [Candidatus Nesterenkonia stercoripullorum]|nr:polyribonucleotide nucleotidyltransferase [Candidatus Nesterenkonia stercoripullorum]